LDENYLKWCFWQLNRDAAPGVDRVDFYEYWENLDENIFLGFEFRRAISRNSKPIIRRRTSRKKIRAPIATFTEWIKTKCELSYNWAGFEDLLNQFLIPAPKITEKYPSKQLKLVV
jgi:hypothetical protein